MKINNKIRIKACKRIIKVLNKEYKYYENFSPYSVQNYKIDKIYNIFFKLLLQVKELHPELLFNPNHKTIPAIFYNNSFIGGYSDLIKIL